MKLTITRADVHKAGRLDNGVPYTLPTDEGATPDCIAACRAFGLKPGEIKSSNDALFVGEYQQLVYGIPQELAEQLDYWWHLDDKSWRRRLGKSWALHRGRHGPFKLGEYDLPLIAVGWKQVHKWATGKE